MSGLEFLFLLVPVPFVVWAVMHAAKVAAELDGVWRAAAEQLGGTFEPESFSRPRGIIATVEDVMIEVDHHRAAKGPQYTRIRAKARVPSSLSLRISHLHDMSAIDLETAQRWVDGAVLERVHAAQGYAFEIDNRRVTALMPGFEENADHLVAAIRAVACLANGQQRLLRVWRTVAKRHGGKVRPRSKRWATLTLELDGVSVTMDTTKVGEADYTFASAQVVGATREPFLLAGDEAFVPSEGGEMLSDDLSDYTLWCYDRDAVLAQLDPRARRRIAEFGPAEVRAEEDEVRVTWAGVCIDEQELEEGAALAALLASPAARVPYR